VSKEALAAGADGAYGNAIFQPCYYLPFRKIRQFVGRATILEALEKKLFIEQSETVALVGLGGIGKTQVALQFAYSVKANKQEYSIFWVAALSEASSEKAYAELAHRLGVKKSKEDEDIKDLVHYHLCSKKAGNWLLIIDNADDMEVVIGLNEKHGVYRYLPDVDWPDCHTVRSFYQSPFRARDRTVFFGPDCSLGVLDRTVRSFLRSPKKATVPDRTRPWPVYWGAPHTLEWTDRTWRGQCDWLRLKL